MSLFFALIHLEWNIARSYRLKQLAIFLQLIMIAGLFYFISQTMGSVPFLGGSYFPFVLSGLAYQHLSSGLASGAPNTLVEWRELGVLEPIMFSPSPPWKIYLQAGGGAFLRAATKFLIFVTVLFTIDNSVAIGNINGLQLLLGLGLIIVFALAVSLIQTMSFLIFKRVSPSDFFATALHLFLSGIYFPIEILPGPLKILATINPGFHALALLRVSLGISSPDHNSHQFTNSSLILGTWIVALIAAAFLCYKWGEKHLRKTGEHRFI